MFVTALLLYTFTLAPGLLWGGGDFAKFQTQIFTLEIEAGLFGHPLWVVLARPFIWLPVRDIAYRANLASAAFAAAAVVFVFQAAMQLTRSAGASLLAAGSLLVSHTFWTYAVLPKPYSLNALLSALMIYLLLRWGGTGRGRYLYGFAVLFGLSPLNHLVMLTAAVGFVAYIFLTMWRPGNPARSGRQLPIAAGLYALSLAPYLLLITIQGEAQATAGGVLDFLHGLLGALGSPEQFLHGIGLGLALWIYQFPLSFAAGIVGFIALRKSDRAAAWMLAFIGLGVVAFLLGATDPGFSGEYVWNLHYYLLLYIAAALAMAVGFRTWRSRLWRTNARWAAAVLLSLAAPVFVYALAPAVARWALPAVPGFRELPGRDNFRYVLSPWKQKEHAPRAYADELLTALPANSVFFSDYGIWSMIRYLQVVEGERLDVENVVLPGAGSGKQLPLILRYAEGGVLYLGDVGRYYEIEQIRSRFRIADAGPIYRLLPLEAEP